MRVEGGNGYGALTVTQGPIFIIGIKDKSKRIICRSLFIPVKDEKGKWRFELHMAHPYGIGEKEIDGFAKKIEETLKKEDYYKGVENIITKGKELTEGTLPKTKTTPSSETTKFWRDNLWEEVKLEITD
jgi:hypothetical protein